MLSKINSKITEIKDNWRALLLTLTIGLVGSLVFVYLKFPLPWLLGALFATTAAAMAGRVLWVPQWLRTNSFIVLGALFGTSVSPEFIDNFIKWLPSMISVCMYVILVMPFIIFYLIKVVKLDMVTAYFSSAPGGLLPMATLGGELGGDEKTISLIQSARIIWTVSLIPFSFALFGGYVPSGNVGTGGSFATLDLFGGLILLGVSIAGYFLAKVTRVPTAHLMGPMIAIALLSMSGLNSSEVPDSLVAIAQWIIGSNIGTMFNYVKPKVVARTLFHGSITSIFMVGAAAIAAMEVHYLIDLPFNSLVLAFAPGGFAEMALVGFALGIDIAFLVTHQLTRYFFVILMIPPCLPLYRRFEKT